MTMYSSYQIIIAITVIIVLPLLVIQTRFFLYRKRSSSRLENLMEMLPHDLAIMGMTLAAAAMTNIAFSAKDVSSIRLMYSIAYVIIPFYTMALIPIIENRQIRLLLGMFAYICGSALFVIQHMIISP